MKNCKSLILGSILALLVLPLVGTASAQNLLENPGFETGDFTGWQALGGNADAIISIQSPENGPSLPGMYHALMDNQGEAIGLTLKQSTPVGSAMAGTVFYSYDLKLLQADVGGVLFVEIWAEQDGAGIIGGSGLMGPLWPWEEWTFFEGSFEAPAGTDFLTIQIMANTGANVDSNCIVQVDNVYLSQEGPPVATESATWSGVKAMYR